jgi:hypothetical protein
MACCLPYLLNKDTSCYVAYWVHVMMPTPCLKYAGSQLNQLHEHLQCSVINIIPIPLETVE